MTNPEINLNKLVILDNTVLSNFALVKRADLVTGIWVKELAWRLHTTGRASLLLMIRKHDE